MTLRYSYAVDLFTMRTPSTARPAERIRVVAQHLGRVAGASKGSHHSPHLLAAPCSSPNGSTTSSTDNHQIFVATIPTGPLKVEDFVAKSSPVPSLTTSKKHDGKVLVEVAALTIGAGQRAGLQGSATYMGSSDGRGRVDVPMAGTGVGRVLESRFPGINKGDLVTGNVSWQTHAAVDGSLLTAVPAGVDAATMLGALGTNGLTAYFGLLDIGKPKAGDTVVVSGAAGSVGHIAGQIAKLHGCRVVGVAGSEEKCKRLVNELGFDAAVNYKSATFREDFKAATPDRIDVYFDNTGGMILQSALFRMASFGRIVCCGNISQYDTATPGGGPRGVPGLLVNNQIKMQGFVVFSYMDQYEEARQHMSAWVREGKLQAWTTQYDGLDRAPQAFVDMLGGVTRGTTIITVP